MAAACPPLLAALIAAGCGGGTTSGDAADSADLAADVAAVTDEQLQGTQISLSRFFGDCAADVGTSTDLSTAVGECPTITTLTNKFNAENEWGIQVERLGGAAWDSYYDTLNAAFAGGNPPNVAIMHGSSLVDYAQRGLLVPLDGMPGVSSQDLEDAVPAATTAIEYDGSTYALPFDVHAALAHVNVDLFEQAGLVDASGQPVLPNSPEEFLSAAQQMEQRTGKDFLAVARVGDQLGVHLFESLLAQQGVGILNEEGTEANLDTPEAKETLEFVSTLFEEGHVNGDQTYDAAQESFLNGEAAMLFNGTWVVDQYDTTTDFTYQAMDFPTLYGEPGVWGDSHVWALPEQEDGDPVQYRAALEFIKYLYANDQAWALGTGHIAARQSILNSADYAAAPQRAGYAETGLTNAKPVPHISSWPAVSDALVASIESVWFQGNDVDTALQQGDAAVENALRN